MKKRGKLAISQIIILIIGIVAIGYALGDGIRSVDAAGSPEPAVNTLPTSLSAVEKTGDYIKLKNTFEAVDANGKKFTITQIRQSTTAGTYEVIDSSGNLGSITKDKLPSGLLDRSGNIGIDKIDLTGAPQTPFNYAGKKYVQIDNRMFLEEKGVKTEITDKKLIKDITNPPGVWGKSWGTVKVLAENAGYGLAVMGIVKWVAGAIWKDDPELSQSLGYAAGGGLFAGKTALDLFGKKGVWSKGWAKSLAPGWGIAIGVAAAVAIFLLTYKKTDQETVSVTCLPWDAPTGGNYCENCNKQGDLPCSEYQCKSLGQGCSLINPGTTEEKCAWVNDNDINPPVIRTSAEALMRNYEYRNAAISPPDSGTKIIYTGDSQGCVQAFNAFSFGITLDEPGKCKIDPVRKGNFSEMDYFLSDGLLRYNHTYTMSAPTMNSLEQENITVQNDGKYELYVRCQDANGRTNVGNFVFKYCVQKGPDTTPPLIVSSSLPDETPVPYEQDTAGIDISVNEPATCKWSHIDQSYDAMENEMTNCGTSVSEMNAQLLYTCSAELNGIKDRERNNFYFRCKDQPLADESNRMEMRESYKVTLIGTQPLNLVEVTPNGTIKDSTSTVHVILGAKTSAGYNEGESKCYFRESGEADYNLFLETDSYVHSQELWVEEGDYSYDIKCVDPGGNSDNKTLSFRVETDDEAPIVVRAYKDGVNLKIITDEEAECVYGFDNCDYLFDDGEKMLDENNRNHYVSWDSGKTFYIKCKDQYGTEPPNSNTCSIIVSPSDV